MADCRKEIMYTYIYGCDKFTGNPANRSLSKKKFLIFKFKKIFNDRVSLTESGILIFFLSKDVEEDAHFRYHDF